MADTLWLRWALLFLGVGADRVAVCFVGQFVREASPSAAASAVFGLPLAASPAAVHFDAFVATSDRRRELPAAVAGAAGEEAGQSGLLDSASLATRLRERCGFSKVNISTSPYDPIPYAWEAARSLGAALCCEPSPSHAWMPHRVLSWLDSVQRCTRMAAESAPVGTYRLLLLTRLDVWDELSISGLATEPAAVADGAQPALALSLRAFDGFDVVGWRQRGLLKDQALLFVSEELWRAHMPRLSAFLPTAFSRVLARARMAGTAGGGEGERGREADASAGVGAEEGTPREEGNAAREAGLRCAAAVPEHLLREHLALFRPANGQQTNRQPTSAEPLNAEGRSRGDGLQPDRWLGRSRGEERGAGKPVGARLHLARRVMRFKVPVFREKEEPLYAAAVYAQLQRAASAPAACADCDSIRRAGSGAGRGQRGNESGGDWRASQVRAALQSRAGWQCARLARQRSTAV